MNEKDFLQNIKKDAESLTPPASLQPEAIEQMLRDRQDTPQNRQDMPRDRQDMLRNQQDTPQNRQD